MLVFVIPLKSAQVSHSWEHVTKLFERCIRSVCNQTSTNFRVIVVCHEKPQIKFSHPHITYIEVDFPPPSISDSKELDKIRKIFVGLNYAGQLKPSHTMNVDADDCVSKHLAEFVEERVASNGWFINRGYVYQDGSKFVFFKRKDFQRWCGTSHIIRHGIFELPKNIEDECVNLKSYYWPHRTVIEKLAQQGKPIQPLPFAGSVYVLGHGDNDSDNFRKLIVPKGYFHILKRMIFNFRPFLSSIRNEFSFYNIQ